MSETGEYEQPRVYQFQEITDQKEAERIDLLCRYQNFPSYREDYRNSHEPKPINPYDKAVVKVIQHDIPQLIEQYQRERTGQLYKGDLQVGPGITLSRYGEMVVPVTHVHGGTLGDERVATTVIVLPQDDNSDKWYLVTDKWGLRVSEITNPPTLPNSKASAN